MLRIVYTEAKVITGKRYNSTYHYKDIVYKQHCSHVLGYKSAEYMLLSL